MLSQYPTQLLSEGSLRGANPTVAPELCIEIMSPGDTLPEALDKAQRYFSWGSLRVWIIDPEKRTAWVFSGENGDEPAWISPRGTLK